MFRRLAALAKTGVPLILPTSSANEAKTASSGAALPSQVRSNTLVAGKASTISGLSTLRLSRAAIGQMKVSIRNNTSGRINAPYLSFFIRSARLSCSFSETVFPVLMVSGIVAVRLVMPWSSVFIRNSFLTTTCTTNTTKNP